LQQTRGFDEASGSTYAIRTKEDADDYRYFADPDLPPFLITEEMIDAIQKGMPPTQKQRVESLSKEYHLSDYDAAMLASNTDLENYFKEIISYTTNIKSAVNWVLNPLKNWTIENETGIEESGIHPKSIAKMIMLIDEGKITYGIAVQKIFPQLLKDPSLNVYEFAERNNLILSGNNSDVDEWINAVLQKYPQKVTEFRKGKKD
jgi:aspartyl-tRNA(Asn)/glutamyl-tRNA(Gln) amidotransferase subunit B